ncbi:MAG: hypothetical protein HPY69_15205 [Armatimonadetes bacterium]|nr:hypothetical protein [Armatimonadota bacterium]
MVAGANGAVPPPWRPIKADGRFLVCWNRVYDFGDGLFPARVNSGGHELLSAPMHLAVKVDPQPDPTWSGVDQVWEPAAFTMRRQAPDVVEFVTRAQSQALLAECQWRFEFDGMLLCELSVRARNKPVLARRMDLVLPLTPENAMLYHHNPIKPIAQWDFEHDPFNSGAVPAEGLFLPFVHTLWLGNERRGLQWFAESDEGLAPLGYFASLNRERRLTLNLTGLRKLSPGRPFRFTFGLIASPVKPMLPTDAVRWSWQIIGDESLKPDCPDPSPRLEGSAAAGINSSFAVNITELVQRGRRDRDFRRAWQRLNRAAERAGITLQACISWSTMAEGHRATPEGITRDWLMWPELAMDYEEGRLYYPCVGGGFREWLLGVCEEGFRDFGLRGVYLDGPGIAVLCANRAHGCGYEDERGIHQTLPILAARDLMKRLYYISRSGPEPGLIVAHMSGFMQLPSLSFADATLGTEHIAGWYPDQNPRYTLAGFRAEVGGHQYGIPSLWLYKNSDRPTLYNALSLLHDLVPASFDGTTVAFTKAYNDFGAFEAQWVGYWESVRPVDTTDSRLKVSSYLKPGPGTLTTVANLSLDQVEATLTFDREALELGQPGVLEVVASREATIASERVSFAPGGWALLRIGDTSR